MAIKYVPFFDVCDFEGGTQPPKEQFLNNPMDGYVRLLQIQDFNNDNKAVYVPDKRNIKKCLSDDVLIGRYGASIGRILRGKSGAYNVAIVKTVPDKNKLEKDYLYHFLNSPNFQNFITNIGSRAAQAGFNKVDFEDFFIPLPPLDEQCRIAAILDKADAIRRKRQESIRLTEEFLRSTFLDMFGDPVTNPKGWEVANCDQLCKRITVGIVVQPASYYKPSGVPALRSLNIRENKISADTLVYFSEDDNQTILSKTRVWEGDILLVRSGQPGTAAVVPKELNGVNAIDILIATPNRTKVNPTYLSYYFNSEGGKQLVLGEQRGQIQKHLNVGSLKVAPIPLPPIYLQEQFACIADKAAKSMSSQQTSKFVMGDFFNSLTHRAFRGEL